jgi:hypothetical protein
VTVTSTSQRGVLDPAPLVVLYRDARPMIHGVGEPVVTGLSPDDDAALARALGNRRDSGQAGQGGVVTSLQGIEGLCQQRGEDDPSHSRRIGSVLQAYAFGPSPAAHPRTAYEGYRGLF